MLKYAWEASCGEICFRKCYVGNKTPHGMTHAIHKIDYSVGSSAGLTIEF